MNESTPTTDALHEVIERAGRIPFFKLVRHVERLLPALGPAGGKGPFGLEALRFRHDPALVFHARDVTRVAMTARGSVEVTTSFAGLTGSVSPMPLFFVDGLELDDEDNALQREFLDIFHHRLLGLLARGMLKLDYPSSHTADLDDARSREILLLCGLHPDHAERLSQLDRAWLLRFAPLLIALPDNAERLRVGLHDRLRPALGDIPIRIIPFAGGHERLEDSERPKLGVDLTLSQNSVLGRRILVRASRVRVCIGPLPPEQCERLSLHGDLYPILSATARLLVPEHIDIELELAPTHAPALRLQKHDKPILGTNSWLASKRRPTPLSLHVSRTPA